MAFLMPHLCLGTQSSLLLLTTSSQTKLRSLLSPSTKSGPIDLQLPNSLMCNEAYSSTSPQRTAMVARVQGFTVRPGEKGRQRGRGWHLSTHASRAEALEYTHLQNEGSYLALTAPKGDIQPRDDASSPSTSGALDAQCKHISLRQGC